MNQFLIQHTFVFKPRNYFVVAGIILNGRVAKGMVYSPTVNKNLKIISVEIITYELSHSAIALLFANEETDLSFLFKVGETILLY